MCWKAALAPDDMTKRGGKLPPYGQKGSVGPKKKSSVLILVFFFFCRSLVFELYGRDQHSEWDFKPNNVRQHVCYQLSLRNASILVQLVCTAHTRIVWNGISDFECPRAVKMWSRCWIMAPVSTDLMTRKSLSQKKLGQMCFSCEKAGCSADFNNVQSAVWKARFFSIHAKFWNVSQIPTEAPVRKLNSDSRVHPEIWTN